MSTCKDSMVKEYRDIMGLFLSNYVYGILNGEILDIRHFAC